MDVVFVVMPFADVGRPAMGVSLLKAEAAAAGFSSRILYCNVTLAERMGVELYQQISSGLPPDVLAGEAWFAADLFGDAIPDAQEYLDKILAQVVGVDSALIKAFPRTSTACASYLDECARLVMEAGPTVVGFTTTFHQTCACLAVAKRLKALAHPPIIVFGGANCEGEMGLQMIQSFPWIDYVCCGEADISFPLLLKQVMHGEAARPIPGVLARDTAHAVEHSAAVQDMNQLPMPDFDEYFARWENSPLRGSVDTYVIVETSRGCWWGAKHHCTFCGLNGDTMAFRSKTPDRAFEEMDYLSRRYGTQRIGCVDNILDMRYVETLFPKLAASDLDLNLFYEVKANLRYDQLVKMRRGGVRQIQPGIESFSNGVLRLMEKGCTGPQNIQLLRWCKELGIDVAWNLLAGFPNESPAEYDKMATLVPLLTHLDPPCSCAQIRLDRFSPFHARADAYGFRRMRPARAYFYVFPLGRRELSRLAYFFDFDYDDQRQTVVYLEPVRREVQRWWQARNADEAKRPTLDARIVRDAVIVTDSRPIARAPRHELTGTTAAVFTRCDAAATLSSLLRAPELIGEEASTRAALATLRDAGLVAEIDEQFVSLAVFRDRPPSMTQSFRGVGGHASITRSQAAAPEPLLRVV